MGLILNGDFYRPDERPARLAPEGQEMPRWFPMVFLLSGIALAGVLGLTVSGLLTWAARTYVEVTPEPVEIHEPQSLKRGWTPAIGALLIAGTVAR